MKYLMATIAAAGFVMVTIGPSPAIAENGWVPPLGKKLEAQRKKPVASAHRVITVQKKKKNDFSKLNH